MTVMGPIWCESERMDQPRPPDLTFMLRKLTSKKNAWEFFLYLQRALDNRHPHQDKYQYHHQYQQHHNHHDHYGYLSPICPGGGGDTGDGPFGGGVAIVVMVLLVLW